MKSIGENADPWCIPKEMGSSIDEPTSARTQLFEQEYSTLPLSLSGALCRSVLVAFLRCFLLKPFLLDHITQRASCPGEQFS